MPVFLDRLPLPSLKAYTAISVLLLSCSIYYAVQVTSQPGYNRNGTVAATAITPATLDTAPLTNVVLTPSPSAHTAHKEEDIIAARSSVSFLDIFYYLVEEPLCIWTLINMAFCCLILIGKVIQKIVFGELRVSEQQHIKDKFWNFVFYKFIFIFGVMNVQFMDEVILWCSWFLVLGFLHLLAQLCKDRFQYLSFSPTMPKWTHVRLLSLLVGILLTSSFLLSICVLVGFHAGINTFAFMGAECVLLIIRTSFVIVRYAIHLWDMNHDGVWENRGTYIYYTELVLELLAAFIDLLHHIHMLLWSNIFLSMASLVICMQIRYLSYEIQRRFKKHKNYLRVIQHMERNYPMGTAEELAANSDDCAICWDRMDSARKLPCGHLFHNSCLQSWLEQDTSCPTCRTSLADPSDSARRSQSSGGGRGVDADRLEEALGPDRLPGAPIAANLNIRSNRSTTNHFFHFDASRYVSWLPSFSVEVTHTQLLHRQAQMQTSQLDNMTWQVQQLFPQMPLNIIQNDLRVTRSVAATVDNILEERLVAPFQMQVSRMAANTHDVSGGGLQVYRQRVSSPGEPSTETTSGLSTPMTDGSGAAGDAGSTGMLPLIEDDGYDAVETESQFTHNNVANPNLSKPYSNGGGRFSKSSQERERMLANRKDELVRQAKKRYMSRMLPKVDSSGSGSGSGSCSDASGMASNEAVHQAAKDDVQAETSIHSDVESRRHCAYRAARRRLKTDENDT